MYVLYPGAVTILPLVTFTIIYLFFYPITVSILPSFFCNSYTTSLFPCITAAPVFCSDSRPGLQLSLPMDSSSPSPGTCSHCSAASDNTNQSPPSSRMPRPLTRQSFWEMSSKIKMRKIEVGIMSDFFFRFISRLLSSFTS